MNKLVKMKNAAVNSPKTSLGAVALIVGVLAMAIRAFDGGGLSGVLDMDWAVIVPAIVAAYSLLSARDNDTSSEDAGAK